MNNKAVCYIAYSRVDKCRQTLDALCKCEKIEDYDVHIFSDAPQNEAAIENVRNVRQFLKEYSKKIDSNTHIEIHEAERNLGSFKSISGGLQYCAKMYESVVLVEEDVLVSRWFLRFVDDALTYFSDNKRVFAVSGYNPTVELMIGSDCFFSERFCCYGLGMKSEVIQDIEWDIDKLKLNKINQKFFNKIAKDISACFNDDLKGRRELETSWDIIIFYNMLLKHAVQVLPKHSCCTNIGFDGSGEFSISGLSHNENFDFFYYPPKFELSNCYLSEAEECRFYKAFIQDTPKKAVLRIGRRITSGLHISRIARDVKKWLIR